MSIEDREWYREHHRQRTASPPAEPPRQIPKPSSPDPSLLPLVFVLALLGFALFLWLLPVP